MTKKITSQAKSVVTLHELLNAEGKPMKMRLRTPHKKDSNGNKIPDFVDPQGRPHYVKRHWYSCFEYKKVFYGVSLKAVEKEEVKAFKNLTILFNEVETGKYRKGLKTKIKFLRYYDL